jgi:hypothetical protein
MLRRELSGFAATPARVEPAAGLAANEAGAPHWRVWEYAITGSEKIRSATLITDFTGALSCWIQLSNNAERRG